MTKYCKHTYSKRNVVSGHVKQLGLVLSSLQTEQSVALEVVRNAVADLRTVLTRHHGLVAGVRSLLRTLAKVRVLILSHLLNLPYIHTYYCIS